MRGLTMYEAFWTGFGWVAGVGFGIFCIIILFIGLARFIRWSGMNK